MKNIIIIASLLLGMPLMAQTKVVKKNAVKANNFGITYSLPKTSLVVDAEVTKVTCKAGPYYQYAEKYLGVKDAVTEDKVYFDLGKISLINRGLPDADNTYIVEFKQGTVAPYAYLTEDGLLCSINAEYTPVESELDAAKKNKGSQQKVTDASVFSEELLMAGSTAKQAEVAAKQIYRIRESRLNILTGEADNLPPDGEAMKLVIQQLEEQEKALTNLFTGILTKETEHYEVSIIPHDNLDKEVLFRFSKQLGIVDADDLGGTPVYMNLKATERAPILDAKEAEKKQKELEKQRVPKGGITAALRKEAPRHLSSTDLIEQNKRLNLEKQNYELKEKLKEYENQNRSVLAKTADLFVDEARKNLTKYAARTATDMLTAALDSKLKGTEYAGVAKMAKDSFNLDAILKNSMDKKK